MSTMNLFKHNEIPSLALPKRFEVLERLASSEGVGIDNIVERVDDAARRVDSLLRQAKQGGVGRFEIFLGFSGSGKTTFFRTLATFFKGVEVFSVGANVPLLAVASTLEAASLPPGEAVAVLYDRDNPKITPDEASAFFEQLRVFFRRPSGRVVVIWPITDTAVAEMLAERAWSIGRDSVVESEETSIFRFTGVPKDRYYEVADITSRSLNGGRSLEAFGLTQEIAKELITTSNTLGELYGKLERRSVELNSNTKQVLKERTVPAVWVLLAGDDNNSLNLTVANLTQGTRKYLDIDRIGEILDAPGANTLYLGEWKERRGRMAYLMRLLDVRLFELPPNVALHAFRAFGTQPYKTALKLQATNVAQAKDALRATRFYQALLGAASAGKAVLPPTPQETAYEYIRLQRKVGRDTPSLNKALAQLLGQTLSDDGVEARVEAEQASLDHLPNKPDILVSLPNGAKVCLEPTWRTTGTAVPNELEGQQNTLSVGHIEILA